MICMINVIIPCRFRGLKIDRHRDMALDEPWTLMGANISWSSVADNATECPPELTAAMHSAWVFKYFKECVTNVRQWFAFVIGMLSIVCWLVAQVP